MYVSCNVRQMFWQYLEDEVSIAKQNGTGCIIMMDGNSWLGPSIIPNDPHKQNENGKLFENFLSNNRNITLLNAQDFCTGLITRSRIVNGKVEKSVIDLYLSM